MSLQPPDRPEPEELRELKLICMRNLLSATEERVYFKDLMSRFLFVSEGWIDAYAPGRSAEELMGKTDFDVFSSQHAAAAFADEQRIIRTGEPIAGQLERETYSGRADAWVSTTKMPLLDTHGQIIGTFGISRDVTAQISAEQALAQQAKELSAQNEQLRELDRLKDEFIGLVSHELRTPLTSIIGYIALLRDERSKGLNADHFAEVIERNAQRLLRLVGDLLFLSRIQSGQLTMELRRTDLASIAAETVAEMEPEAQRKNVSLSLSHDDAPTFAADPTRIAQLLGNLISNAVKFTPEGGRIEVSVRTDGDHAVLAVRDTGIGIPVPDQEQIFERFFRSASATRQVIPGTGLGLTISKAIVDAHHGTISVDSQEGQGSTFTVRLPLLPVPSTTARLASGGDLVPEAAVQVQLVAAGLAGRRVANVGVQRVAIVGGLGRAVGPLDRAELAGYPWGGRDRALDRRPVGRTRSVAHRLGGGIRREPVQREALGVGQHAHPSDLHHFQAVAGGYRAGAAGRASGHAEQHQCDDGHSGDHGPGGRDGGDYPVHQLIQRPGRAGLAAARGYGHDCQHRERGYLDDSGDDPGRGAHLGEPEQPDPDGQQVASQRGQGEPGAGRRGQPAAGQQHRDGQGEGRDDLEQEQPADGRNRPVAGQVQIQVHGPGGEEQARSSHPEDELP
jgi:PAS domain S-box-containing protein